jgi:hypothetical protein
VFTLAERGVELSGKIALLGGALRFQLRNRGVHFVDLLIELRQCGLRFAKLTRGGGDGLILRFQLGEQRGTLLLLLAYCALFSGNIGLNRLQLCAIVGVGR